MAVNIIFFLYSVVTLLLNYRTLDCFFFFDKFYSSSWQAFL